MLASPPGTRNGTRNTPMYWSFGVKNQLYGNGYSRSDCITSCGSSEWRWRHWSHSAGVL